MTRLIPLAGVIRLWNRSGMFRVAVLCAIASALILALGACAIAPRTEGGYVLGIGMSGEPGTPDSIGRAAGGILGALGVPGAGLIGTGVTAIAAAFGWGAHQRRKGENVGWNDAAATYSPPPGPSAGAVRPQPAPADPRRDSDPAGPT